MVAEGGKGTLSVSAAGRCAWFVVGYHNRRECCREGQWWSLLGAVHQEANETGCLA